MSRWARSFGPWTVLDHGLPGGEGQDAKYRQCDLQGGDHALVAGTSSPMIPLRSTIGTRSRPRCIDPQHPPQGGVSVAATLADHGRTRSDLPAVVDDLLREPKADDRYPPSQPSPDGRLANPIRSDQHGVLPGAGKPERADNPRRKEHQGVEQGGRAVGGERPEPSNKALPLLPLLQLIRIARVGDARRAGRFRSRSGRGPIRPDRPRPRPSAGRARPQRRPARPASRRPAARRPRRTAGGSSIRQRSKPSGSAGGSGSRAGCAPRPASRPRGSSRGPAAPAVGGSGDGDTDTSACVYGLRGERITASAGPISMIRPRYITAIRSAMTQASDRSWVMNRYVSPRSSRRSSISRSSSVRIDTSSIDTGSSATMTLRPHTSAPAMTTRWRWPPDSSCGIAARESAAGRRPAASSAADDPLVPLAPRSPMPLTIERLRDEVVDRLLRVERLVRVLEDELHAPAVVAQRLADQSA